MSFPPGTEMFQFPGFASKPYVFRPRYPRKGGFPHSDICGSTIARISPQLFAACHVLHRLLAPRHPPNALISLAIPPSPPARRTKPRTRLQQHRKPHTHTPGSFRCQTNPIFTCQGTDRPGAAPLRAPPQNSGFGSAAKTSHRPIHRPTPHQRQGMEANGFEPMTPCLQSRCSTN